MFKLGRGLETIRWDYLSHVMGYKGVRYGLRIEQPCAFTFDACNNDLVVDEYIHTASFYKCKAF